MEATFHPKMKGSRVHYCPTNVREGFKAFNHALWFKQPEGQAPVIWQLPKPGNVRTLGRFRLGAHHHACEVGRGLGLRDDRGCLFCGDLQVEDEVHVLVCSAW